MTTEAAAPTATTETPTETRKPGSNLRSFTCSTCGELRNLLDFYDDVHSVWITTEMGVHIDHGEAAPA